MRALVATITVAVLPLATSDAATEGFTEPESGFTFPLERDGMTLLGAGMRAKKVAFVGVKVYATALYVSQDALEGPLAAYAGKTGTDAFFKELVAGDFPKLLVLKFNRDLSEKQIQGSMRDALKGADKVLLERFVTYFPKVEKGEECLLAWAPGGVLESTMAGEKKPPIEDRAFATALFDLYLGKKPFQDSLKKALVSRAPEVLAP